VFLLDASVWIAAKVRTDRYFDTARALVVDAACPVAALDLTLCEVANGLGARQGRRHEAVELCRLVVGRCGDSMLAVDPKLIEVGRAFRCNEGQLWANIVIPASLPFIVTGLRLALGRGLIGMVLADLYTALSGIGYLIARTAATYQVNRMFVPIVTLGLLGVTLTALLRLAEKYVAPWTNVADEN